jgi:short-subunit dehydrogenase
MTKSESKGIAAITGASTGIGATYADRLARRGYNLLLVARNAAQLEAVAAALRANTGVRVEILPADLTVKADLDRVAARLAADQAITMVVNNAGTAVAGQLLDADADALEGMIQLNVIAATRVAVTAASAFAKRGGGTLVNIASVVALAPELLNGAYSGTKAYLLNLSQALAAEVGKLGVRVQAVLPGATRTEIWARAGIDVDGFPASMVMEVGEMVDASLAGLDQGESVTIPSLPDVADWDAYNAARAKLGPNLSRNHAAERYRVPAGQPASNVAEYSQAQRRATA